MVFLGLILVYALMDIFEEIMALRGNQKYIDKMLGESKSEAELAIEAANAQESINLNVDIDASMRKEDK